MYYLLEPIHPVISWKDFFFVQKILLNMNTEYVQDNFKRFHWSLAVERTDETSGFRHAVFTPNSFPEPQQSTEVSGWRCR